MRTMIVLLALAAQPVLTENQVQTLRDTRVKIDGVVELLQKQQIDQAGYTKYAAVFLKDAEKVTGETGVTPERLDELIRIQRQKAAWYANLVTTRGILIFLSCVAAVVAFCWLCGIYLIEVITSIPLVAWEVTGYAASVALLFLVPNVWWAFAGALLLIPSLGLNYRDKLPSYGTPLSSHWRGNNTVNSLVCAVLWGASAFYHQSPLLGFMSVMALESFLGFVVIATPLCYSIGFEEEDHVVGATVASFAMLCLYVVTSILGRGWGPFSVYKTGTLWMGCFVFYLGMLILSDRWYGYGKRSNENYLLVNALTFVAGLGAFYLGSTYGITPLLGIGGTFFTLFVLEKYYDIKWSEVGYAWSLAGLAAGGFLVAHLVDRYPQYFVFHVTG